MNRVPRNVGEEEGIVLVPDEALEKPEAAGDVLKPAGRDSVEAHEMSAFRFASS